MQCLVHRIRIPVEWIRIGRIVSPRATAAAIGTPCGAAGRRVVTGVSACAAIIAGLFDRNHDGGRIEYFMRDKGKVFRRIADSKDEDCRKAINELTSRVVYEQFDGDRFQAASIC
ncbi:hypothetical protein [Burkholderia stabilis]|uniref:hypothetical protein n=1 Tax=Burkholderia stabilis TaxID=95485 RepID=UPI001591209E|nr:hypothetical protein [Burkholderia stabilis]